jgi:hypothetical protein
LRPGGRWRLPHPAQRGRQSPAQGFYVGTGCQVLSSVFLLNLSPFSSPLDFSAWGGGSILSKFSLRSGAC